MSLAPYLTVNFHPSVSAPLLFPVFLSHQLPLYLCVCGSGVVINGELIGAKTLQNSKLKTYFGTVGVFYRTEGVMVTVRTDRINVVEGKNNHSFSWSGTAHINTNGCVCVSVCLDVWEMERKIEGEKRDSECVYMWVYRLIFQHILVYKKSGQVTFFFTFLSIFPPYHLCSYHPFGASIYSMSLIQADLYITLLLLLGLNSIEKESSFI